MRKVTCTCDRCGKTVDEIAYTLCGCEMDISTSTVVAVDHWEDQVDLCYRCYCEMKKAAIQLVFDPKGIKSAAEKILEKETAPSEKLEMTKAERNKWIMDLVKEGLSYEYIAEEVGVSKATVGNVVKKMREENNDAD